MNKQELRDKFFKECTDKAPIWSDQDRKINLAPHDLLEWFWKEFKFKQKEAIKELYEMDNQIPMFLDWLSDETEFNIPKDEMKEIISDWKTYREHHHTKEPERGIETKMDGEDYYGPNDNDKRPDFSIHKEPKEGDTLILEEDYKQKTPSHETTVKSGKYPICKLSGYLLFMSDDCFFSINEIQESGVKCRIEKK